MHITLIRHLPTEWNKKTWLQGKRDIEISTVTDENRMKIKQNQELLKKYEPFDLVLASSLKRTHQTAAEYGYKAEAESLLDELDFGSYEGLPKERLIQEHEEVWVENPIQLTLGESVKNLEKRIQLFLKKYEEKDKLLVFGHGSWMRGIVSYFQFGNINHMNKITIENNECIILPFND